jgi:hypothetical protein
MLPMTGSPGIPPGWVALKCWTDWECRLAVKKNNTVTMEINNGIAPRKSFLQRQNQKPQIDL